MVFSNLFKGTKGQRNRRISEGVVTPFGTSAKADVPRKYIGRKVYVIITKNVVD